MFEEYVDYVTENQIKYRELFHFFEDLTEQVMDEDERKSVINAFQFNETPIPISDKEYQTATNEVFHDIIYDFFEELVSCIDDDSNPIHYLKDIMKNEMALDEPIISQAIEVIEHLGEY